MSTDLIVLEEINAASIFNSETKDADNLIEEIRKVALGEVPNLKTAKGRKQIASNAAKVSKCKTYLEDAGKSLVTDEKARLKKIDGVRKHIKESLEDLRDEVRKPLTEWENKEKDRVAKYEGVIAAFIKAGEDSENWINTSLDELNELLAAVEDVTVTKRLQEFEEEAETAKKEAVKKITSSIEQRTKYDADQLKLKEMQETIDKQDKINFEASQRAEAERTAQQAVIDANKETEAAEKRAEIAEQQRITDAENADKQREIEVEAAAQAERDRIEREKQAEIKAEKERESDKTHRGKINRAIVKELLKCGIDESQAKEVVKAIAKNKIPNTKMKKLIFVLLLALSANAHAATAYHTGKSRYVTTVTYQSGISCQYRYLSNTFWRTFRSGYCPSSVQVF